MNYSKMVRQYICKMAMPLALMLAACSDNGNSVVKGDDHSITPLGGTAEETGVVASVSGIARHSLGNGATMRSLVGPGSVIRMAELDSVSFDTTGNTYFTRCDDSTGSFRFDSVSLNSPYVMLELAPKQENDYWEWDGVWSFEDYDSEAERYTTVYSVIIDVREMKNVDVNVMTYLETARLLNLVKQGSGFAEAKQRADRELLDALGMYGDSFDYDRNTYIENTSHLNALNYMDEMFFLWTESNSASLITKEFGKTGTLSTDDSIREFFVKDIYWTIRGESFSDDYKNALYNIVAGMYGLGKCDASVEGKGVEVPGTPERYMNVYCLSGQWTVLNGRYKMSELVPATMGTLLDSRDGIVYKTVTYDVGGQSQTWMAENLRYSDEKIEPINHFDSNYINIFQTMDERFEVYLASLDSTYWNTVSVYKEPDVVGDDSMNVDGEYFRGICPEGWHIPTLKEWSRLLYLMEEASGGCENRDCSDFVENEYLSSHGLRYLHQVGFGDFTYEMFAFMAQSEGKWRMEAITTASWDIDVEMHWSQYEWPYGYVSIRCVKD